MARIHRIIVQKKGLYELDNNNDVVTQVAPNILKCEVTWALGSITIRKAMWCDGILAEHLQTLTDDAPKVLHSICQEIWKTQQWP